MSAITNTSTAQLFTTSHNEKIFTKGSKMGTIGNTSPQEYYFPIVQSYTDNDEYYFCVRGTQANPNQIITPKNLLIERDENEEIVNVSIGEKEEQENILYVLYKSNTPFDESKQPNKKYLLSRCRAINLDTLVNFGKLVTISINGKNELLYFCYQNKEAFFREIETSGFDNYSNIQLFSLAKDLFSNRG